MKRKLGVIFGNLRKESGVGQKEIGRGLVSKTELCSAEKGDREIDYFTLEALFERLGKSLDKFEMILGQEEYVMLSLRDKIMKKIRQGNDKRVEELLAKYESAIEGRREIHIQYASMIRALLTYQQEENHAICVVNTSISSNMCRLE